MVMVKPQKRFWILGLIVGTIILSFFLFSQGILLSPGSAVAGCASFQEPNPPSKFFVPLEPQYNNCVVDGLAKINAETFNRPEGEIRSEMIACLDNMGIDSVKDGITLRPNSQLQAVINCKKEVMETKGINEEIGGGIHGPGAPPIAVSGTSPFKNNCPSIGSRIILLGGGHAFPCVLDKCDEKTGEAELSCQESNFKPLSEGPGIKMKPKIDEKGKIRGLPGSSAEGGDAWSWIKIIPLP